MTTPSFPDCPDVPEDLTRAEAIPGGWIVDGPCGRPGHRGRRHHRPARPRVVGRPHHEGGVVKPTKDQIALATEAILGEEDTERAPDLAAAALEAVLTDIEERIEARLGASAIWADGRRS